MSKTFEGKAESLLYPYVPLSESDEMRLLFLQPYTPDQKVKCTIEHVKLSEKPQYEALSYMWGPKEMKHIEIDGAVIEVRENLWAALRHLAPESGSRVFWIDALCIDQMNIEERNHQVAQMGQIYSMAKEVAVWLGESDMESRIAFQLLSDVSQWKKIWESLKDHPQELQAIKSICERSYWKRLWIVQEILLATEIRVYCGENSCSWFRLWWFLDATIRVCAKASDEYLRPGSDSRSFLYSTVFRALENTSPFRIDGLKNPRRNWKRYHPAVLMELAQEYSDAECEDKRDKIFGLCALAPTCCKEATPIDYSISWQELYQKLWYHFYAQHEFNTWRNPLLVYQKLEQRLQRKISTHPSTISASVQEIRQLESASESDRTIESYCYIRGYISYVSPQLSAKNILPRNLSFTNMNVTQLKYTEQILFQGSHPNLSITRTTDSVDLVPEKTSAYARMYPNNDYLMPRNKPSRKAFFNVPRALLSRVCKGFDTKIAVLSLHRIISEAR